MPAQADVVRLRQAVPGDEFTTISPASWAGKDPPRRDWMVENAFVRGSVALVSGDGGIGKSLLMQQLCTCAALGRQWLGMATQAGRTLFFGCEDDRDELWRRQSGICRSLAIDMTDLGEAGMEIAPRVGRDNILSRLERTDWQMQPTRLMERLLAYCLDRGVSYVVIDTATQTFAGNQNDEQQVTAYVNQLRRLAIAIQGVVVITKHPSMAGRALGTGESGSVSWNNAVRARLYLNRDKSNNLTLRVMKSNYGPAGEEYPIRWERGCFVLDRPEMRTPYSD